MHSFVPPQHVASVEEQSAVGIRTCELGLLMTELVPVGVVFARELGRAVWAYESLLGSVRCHLSIMMAPVVNRELSLLDNAKASRHISMLSAKARLGGFLLRIRCADYLEHGLDKIGKVRHPSHKLLVSN
jgi:hypothetical protein